MAAVNQGVKTTVCRSPGVGFALRVWGLGLGLGFRVGILWLAWGLGGLDNGAEFRGCGPGFRVQGTTLTPPLHPTSKTHHISFRRYGPCLSLIKGI